VGPPFEGNMKENWSLRTHKGTNTKYVFQEPQNKKYGCLGGASGTSFQGQITKTICLGGKIQKTVWWSPLLKATRRRIAL